MKKVSIDAVRLPVAELRVCVIERRPGILSVSESVCLLVTEQGEPILYENGKFIIIE